MLAARSMAAASVLGRRRVRGPFLDTRASGSLARLKASSSQDPASPVDGEGWAMFYSSRELSAISSSSPAVRFDFPLKAVLETIGLKIQVVVHLQAKPELR